ncbi:hypothetical protein GCM10010218_65030 [Streptomyces mashuensis]|uniref:Uncharacterized protein n=1 Tax=Streptomyces mashuensis TaxID=33904 RepID=A0A919EGF3_9ACTN|nr:hypothetical protein GCM10010218_65030 [Streptomyces mashuensis]
MRIAGIGASIDIGASTGTGRYDAIPTDPTEPNNSNQLCLMQSWRDRTAAAAAQGGRSGIYHGPAREDSSRHAP